MEAGSDVGDRHRSKELYSGFKKKYFGESKAKLVGVLMAEYPERDRRMMMKWHLKEIYDVPKKKLYNVQRNDGLDTNSLEWQRAFAIVAGRDADRKFQGHFLTEMPSKNRSS